jgi:hypothetical protein
MKDDKKKISIGKRKDGSKYVELNPRLDASMGSIAEAREKTVVLTFGRFSPPTIGHEKLVNKVVSVAKEVGGTPEIYMSHSYDAKKNPLTYEDKYYFMKTAFGNIVKKSPSRTIIEIAKSLSGKFDKFVVVVGQDRVSEFETLLNKYNGKEFQYSDIKVLSAGDRDPDAEDVTGMSASKMRKLAAEGDSEAFKRGLPKKLQSRSDEVYNAVLKGMKLMKEEYIEEGEDVAEGTPLTLSQRRKRAMVMRRYANKIRVARERARKRRAPPEKLKMRAQRRALDMIRTRLMKQKKYSEMSAPEKIALDKRLARVPKSVIARIARKELPKVRQAEMQRLADLNKEKAESFDLNLMFEQFVNEPGEARKKKFKYLFTREGKVNCDGRFRMFKPKSHMTESVEEFSEQVIDLMNATESLFEGAAVERVRANIEMERAADKRKHKRMLDRAREIDKVRFESIDKSKPKNREYGTDSLVKILKQDTPGENLKEAKTVPPLKHSKTTVPDFVEPSTPDISVLVSKHNKHHLGVGLALKHMMKHALKDRDLDNDGDVDAQDKKAADELTGDPSFDRKKNATAFMQKKYEKEKQHTKAGLAFEDYYAGLSKSTAAKRKAHFKKGAAMDDDNPAAYKPAPGDARAKTRPSVYTKRFKAMYGEEAETSENFVISESAEKSLRDKAEKTGISYGILKKVYDRGVAAWRTGHRPGTTPSQWGHARVNSFATGGKTRQTADADLWRQHSGKNEDLYIDLEGLSESAMTDKIIDAVRKHVLRGENLMDIAWKVSQLAAVDLSAKKIYDMYVSKYGEPKTATIDKARSNAFRAKYGFAAEGKARGFEGKMIDVPNVPVRMANGKIKSFPAGKSSSSKGGDGE